MIRILLFYLSFLRGLIQCQPVNLINSGMSASVKSGVSVLSGYPPSNAIDGSVTNTFSTFAL